MKVLGQSRHWWWRRGVVVFLFQPTNADPPHELPEFARRPRHRRTRRARLHFLQLISLLFLPHCDVGGERVRLSRSGRGSHGVPGSDMPRKRGNRRLLVHQVGKLVDRQPQRPSLVHGRQPLISQVVSIPAQRPARLPPLLHADALGGCHAQLALAVRDGVHHRAALLAPPAGDLA